MIILYIMIWAVFLILIIIGIVVCLRFLWTHPLTVGLILVVWILLELIKRIVKFFQENCNDILRIISFVITNYIVGYFTILMIIHFI